MSRRTTSLDTSPDTDNQTQAAVKQNTEQSAELLKDISENLKELLDVIRDPEKKEEVENGDKESSLFDALLSKMMEFFSGKGSDEDNEGGVIKSMTSKQKPQGDILKNLGKGASKEAGVAEEGAVAAEGAAATGGAAAAGGGAASSIVSAVEANPGLLLALADGGSTKEKAFWVGEGTNDPKAAELIINPTHAPIQVLNKEQRDSAGIKDPSDFKVNNMPRFEEGTLKDTIKPTKEYQEKEFSLKADDIPRFEMGTIDPAIPSPSIDIPSFSQGTVTNNEEIYKATYGQDKKEPVTEELPAYSKGTVDNIKDIVDAISPKTEYSHKTQDSPTIEPIHKDSNYKSPEITIPSFSGGTGDREIYNPKSNLPAYAGGMTDTTSIASVTQGIFGSAFSGGQGATATDVFSGPMDLLKTGVGMFSEEAAKAVEIFKDLGVTVIQTTQSFKRFAESLAYISPQISVSQARAEVLGIQQDIGLNQKYGDNLSKVYDLSTDIWLDVQKTLASIAGPFLEVLVPALGLIKDLMENLIGPIMRMIGDFLTSVMAGVINGSIEKGIQRWKELRAAEENAKLGVIGPGGNIFKAFARPTTDGGGVTLPAGLGIP